MRIHLCCEHHPVSNKSHHLLSFDCECLRAGIRGKKIREKCGIRVLARSHPARRIAHTERALSESQLSKCACTTDRNQYLSMFEYVRSVDVLARRAKVMHHLYAVCLSF